MYYEFIDLGTIVKILSSSIIISALTIGAIFATADRLGHFIAMRGIRRKMVRI